MSGNLSLFSNIEKDPYYVEKRKYFDDKLEEDKKAIKPIKIVVLGVGGGGVNTVARLSYLGLKEAELYAVNTDIQHLVAIKQWNEIEMQENPNMARITPIAIGKETTSGKGAGGDPALAAQAAYENRRDIEKAVEDADLVFITCGEGGGTGTGAAPVIAKITKEVTKRKKGDEKGALVVSIVTFPFQTEGKRKISKAMKGIKALAQYSDTVLVIENDMLLEIVGKKNFDSALMAADELIATIIKELSLTINKPSRINIDFHDVEVIMKQGGIALIGVGESTSNTNRPIDAINSALHNKLMNVEIGKAKGALVHFTISDDITLEEVDMAMRELQKHLDPETEVIYGVRVDPEAPQGFMRALIIITGVHNPYVDEDDLAIATPGVDKIEELFHVSNLEKKKFNPLSSFEAL